jgi:hypothetical protein
VQLLGDEKTRHFFVSQQLHPEGAIVRRRKN